MRVFKLFLRLSKENKAGIIMTLLLTALMIVLFYALPREQQAGILHKNKSFISY